MLGNKFIIFENLTNRERIKNCLISLYYINYSSRITKIVVGKFIFTEAIQIVGQFG